MKLSIRFFGTLRESIGEATREFEVPDDCRVADLREILAEALPAFREFGERVAIAVEHEVAREDRALHEGDEIALLPPVSGGAGTCSLSTEALSEAEVRARVAGPDTGGIVSFIGAVRNHARGSAVDHLEYEAYPAMALGEMEKIAREGRRRWPGTRIAIAHRTGRLEIGEAAVIVVAASAHRAEAFDASRFAIDTLKERVPIWKKEVTPEGASWVDDRP